MGQAKRRGSFEQRREKSKKVITPKPVRKHQPEPISPKVAQMMREVRDSFDELFGMMR